MVLSSPPSSLRGDDRDEDVERAEQRDDPGEDREHRRQPAVGEDRVEAGGEQSEQLPRVLLGSQGAGRGVARDRQDGEGAAGREERRREVDGRRTAERDEHAGDQRTEECPETLHGAGRGVGDGELVGRLDDLGQERRMCRSGERDAGRGERGGGVREHRGSVGHRDRRRRHGHRLAQVRHEKHPGPRAPVADDGRRGRDQDRGDEHDARDQPGFGGAAARVGVRDDRDPRCPLGDAERQERADEATQDRTSEDGTRGAERRWHGRQCAATSSSSGRGWSRAG